ncbi:hypothetical protein SAMN05421595_1463 [Austwickia chelonae]|uniref:Uncharacterized protein n=1 Tax=Austwickia chelonae NBRC 105200 TaxID=1184607 RepID=K6VQI4_9MICO|nr:hypothetical protein [Austwickia chelonae]GAB77625.1 hypothetical protein AUCHE_05_05400 [Austwickia chelonae NBRC 105200]SEW14393.1 hypothetical protein SAMN05421595_1463 [Austwickia chelonae]
MTKPTPQDRTPDDERIDAAFAAIVAEWERDTGPGRSHTATEKTNSSPVLPARPEPRRPSFAVAPEGWRVHLPPEEVPEDDDFEEPDPPLPRGDLQFWGALAGIVGGPVVFVGWALTGPHTTHLPLWLSGLATAAGFALLVRKLPEQHDEGDDGARV